MTQKLTLDVLAHLYRDIPISGKEYPVLGTSLISEGMASINLARYYECGTYQDFPLPLKPSITGGGEAVRLSAT